MPGASSYATWTLVDETSDLVTVSAAGMNVAGEVPPAPQRCDFPTWRIWLGVFMWTGWLRHPIRKLDQGLMRHPPANPGHAEYTLI
jgi:hypothetical protein